MTATVLGGYFIFHKNSYGQYKYQNDLSNQKIEEVKDIASEFLFPNNDIVHVSNMVIIKACRASSEVSDYN
jgi:hypothetical protein